jgi:acyl carrier protein
MTTIERLQEIFRDVFDDETLILTSSTSAKDIEDWDSLAQINLVAAIESEFSMKFDIAEIPTLQNVGDMIDLIEKKL